ncbi:MAG TPA: hypothetical protein VMW29_04125 [Candidatus Bathyarchaeia archaeon]|nr:hypothetical protein [Candidatus Bathyarchaeia archaeon]
MTSLTETAEYAKKIIKYGVIAVLSIIVLKLAITVIKTVWEYFYPTPPPLPTVSFGKLPKLQFPETEKPGELEFSLETPLGGFSDLGTQVKVFKSQPLNPNLLALERAREEAKEIGFSAEPVQISTKIARWTIKDDLNKTLEMDIYSGAFKFYYDWQNKLDLTTENSVPSKDQAIELAKNFLQNIKRLNEDLEQGRIEAEYLQLKGTKMLQAPSLSEAELVKVDFFRKDIDEMPVLTADPETGVVSIIVSGSINPNKKFVSIDFNYFSLDYENFSTYPVKSSSQAWEELKNGQALIVNPLEETKIIIRRVFLAFYDAFEPQEFLQPVFVFQGDKDFVAMVPAITDEWLKE